MRLCMFDKAGNPTLGARRDGALVDLSLAAPGLPGDVVGVIESGDEGLRRLRDALADAGEECLVDERGLRYHVPVARPGKILCLGLNYADHAKEGGHQRPAYPSFFLRTATSLVAHGEPLLRPRASEQLDYEAELVAVVGARARHVPAERGLDVIAGYSVFNDGSIREYQRKTTQWTIGKNFDSTGGFGPDFVTADELPPGCAGLRVIFGIPCGQRAALVVHRHEGDALMPRNPAVEELGRPFGQSRVFASVNLKTQPCNRFMRDPVLIGAIPSATVDHLLD